MKKLVLILATIFVSHLAQAQTAKETPSNPAQSPTIEAASETIKQMVDVFALILQKTVKALDVLEVEKSVKDITTKLGKAANIVFDDETNAAIKKMEINIDIKNPNGSPASEKETKAVEAEVEQILKDAAKEVRQAVEEAAKEKRPQPKSTN